MNPQKIYSCKGRHFKVYDSDQQKVLEHPSDTEEVNLDFEITDGHLCMTITGYVETPMRKPGQKKRIDVYILQEVFAPILPLIKAEMATRQIVVADRNKWKYGAPIARDGRQSVPKLVKLAETKDVEGVVPIGDRILNTHGAVAVVDSEIPSAQQSKWKREGGARQIHFGIFGGSWESRSGGQHDKRVVLKFPLSYVGNDLISAIEENWVS